MIVAFVMALKSEKKRVDEFRAQREKEDFEKLPKLDLSKETSSVAPSEDALEEFSLDELEEKPEEEMIRPGDSREEINRGFAEYEKFLEESLEGADDDEFYDDGDEDAELEALMNFDFDSIKGKSREEVMKMTEGLPENTRKLILAQVDDED